MTTAKTLVRFKGVDSVSLDLGTDNISHALEQSDYWPNGTSDGQIEGIWSDSRSLNASASEDLELDNLSQLDENGNIVKTVQFNSVKSFLCKVTSTGGGSLIMGGGTGGAGAADAWAGSDTPFNADDTLIQVHASDGYFVWKNPAGGAVTDNTADILHMYASGANIDYSFIILGEVD